MSRASQPPERTGRGTGEPARPGQRRAVRAWNRVRAVVAEMNYATRRVYELQVPWSVSGHGNATEEPARGLSAREERALDSISNEMSDSDPGLVTLLNTFTRLASGETMPARDG
jgi:hypothetical protein